MGFMSNTYIKAIAKSICNFKKLISVLLFSIDLNFQVLDS
jgi:hypothetical protein